MRTRVGLRKQLGREPSKQEFEAALAAESIPVTQDDIRNAYDKGEEVRVLSGLTDMPHSNPFDLL